MTKKLLIFILSITLLLNSVVANTNTVSALSGSEFQAGRIIDDSKFFSTPTMTIPNIQNFLNAKVPICDTWGTQPYGGTTRAAYAATKGVSTPFTCLKDSRDAFATKVTETGLCNGINGSSGTAAEIIFWVAQACGVNPQVLIVLLQKEQSLITDDWPWPIQYRSATGYGCPDTAPCDSEYYGFFNQVYNAARQFKRYARDSNLFTYRSRFNNFVQYNPNAACSGSTIYLENQATAGLYNYTPYQPNGAALSNLYGTGDECSAYGNRNFWRMFNEWFGTTYGPPDYSCKDSMNVSGAPSGSTVITYNILGNDYLTYLAQNNTGSECVETHITNATHQAWLTNVATPINAVDPTKGMFIKSKTAIDYKNSLNYILYKNGGNRVEIHRMSPEMRFYPGYYDVATDLTNVDATKGTFVAGDFLGRGYDQMVYVLYKNSSNKAESHMFKPDLTRAIGFRDLVTVIPGINP